MHKSSWLDLVLVAAPPDSAGPHKAAAPGAEGMSLLHPRCCPFQPLVPRPARAAANPTTALVGLFPVREEVRTLTRAPTFAGQLSALVQSVPPNFLPRMSHSPATQPAAPAHSLATILLLECPTRPSLPPSVVLAGATIHDVLHRLWVTGIQGKGLIACQAEVSQVLVPSQQRLAQLALESVPAKVHVMKMAFPTTAWKRASLRVHRLGYPNLSSLPTTRYPSRLPSKRIAENEPLRGRYQARKAPVPPEARAAFLSIFGSHDDDDHSNDTDDGDCNNESAMGFVNEDLAVIGRHAAHVHTGDHDHPRAPDHGDVGEMKVPSSLEPYRPTSSPAPLRHSHLLAPAPGPVVEPHAPLFPQWAATKIRTTPRGHCSPSPLSPTATTATATATATAAARVGPLPERTLPPALARNPRHHRQPLTMVMTTSVPPVVTPTPAPNHPNIPADDASLFSHLAAHLLHLEGMPSTTTHDHGRIDRGSLEIRLVGRVLPPGEFLLLRPWAVLSPLSLDCATAAHPPNLEARLVPLLHHLATRYTLAVLLLLVPTPILEESSPLLSAMTRWAAEVLSLHLVVRVVHDTRGATSTLESLLPKPFIPRNVDHQYNHNHLGNKNNYDKHTHIQIVEERDPCEGMEEIPGNLEGALMRLPHVNPWVAHLVCKVGLNAVLRGEPVSGAPARSLQQVRAMLSSLVKDGGLGSTSVHVHRVEADLPGGGVITDRRRWDDPRLEGHDRLGGRKREGEGEDEGVEEYPYAVQPQPTSAAVGVVPSGKPGGTWPHPYDPHNHDSRRLAPQHPTDDGSGYGSSHPVPLASSFPCSDWYPWPRLQHQDQLPAPAPSQPPPLPLPPPHHHVHHGYHHNIGNPGHLGHSQSFHQYSRSPPNRTPPPALAAAAAAAAAPPAPSQSGWMASRAFRSLSALAVTEDSPASCSTRGLGSADLHLNLGQDLGTGPELRRRRGGVGGGETRRRGTIDALPKANPAAPFHHSTAGRRSRHRPRPSSFVLHHLISGTPTSTTTSTSQGFAPLTPTASGPQDLSRFTLGDPVHETRTRRPANGWAKAGGKAKEGGVGGLDAVRRLREAPGKGKVGVSRGPTGGAGRRRLASMSRSVRSEPSSISWEWGGT